MVANRFGIEQRIFKRERVREGKNSICIVPKNKKVEKKNQIEFIWRNTYLKTEHLTILCRVMTKEWANVMPQILISRAFFQEKEDRIVRFYTSFQVEDNLSGDQIKQIMVTSLNILEECLEKITKKVIENSEINQHYSDDTNRVEIAVKKNSMEIESDELIKRLHAEIENQEKLLNQLAKQQKRQGNADSSDTSNQEYAEKPVKKDSEKKEESLLKNILKEKEIDSLGDDAGSIQKIKEEIEDENNQLEKRVKSHQNEYILSQNETKKIGLLEKQIKDLKKENSDYRFRLGESQSTIEQYETKNKYLNETIEKIQKEKKSLLNQAQKENSSLNSELAESQKKFILLENKYKNHEENVGLLRKKLAQTSIDCEEKTKQLSQITIQLKDEQNKYEKITKELETSQLQVNQLEQDLKMVTVTNTVLKERQETIEQEDTYIVQIEEWRETYQTLLNKYSDLELESYNYRQEIAFLDKQITKIKAEIEIDASSQVSTDQMDVPFEQEDNSQEENDFDYDEDEDYYYFSYESDPYIDEVEAMELTGLLVKEKAKREEKIRDLLSAYDKGKYGEIKIDKSEYRKYVSDLKFLSYRWNQVLNRKDVDTSTDFLGWCAPFIKRIGVFEEGLPVEVKKPLFAKNYVIMNESLYRILKGYNLLSIYLDNYYYRN